MGSNPTQGGTGGSVDLDELDQEIFDAFVETTGDTITGDLILSGANITDIGQINIRNIGTGADVTIVSDSDKQLATLSGTLKSNAFEAAGNFIGEAVDPTLDDEITDAVFADAINISIGNTLAYVCSPTNNSITVLDISIPSNLRILATLQDNTNLQGAIDMGNVGDLGGFVVTDNCLALVDTTNPGTPFVDIIGVITGTNAKSIARGDGFNWYICPQSNDLLQHFAFTGSTFEVTNTLQLSRNIEKLEIFGNYLYATSPIDGGVYIIDLNTFTITTDLTDATNLSETHDVAVHNIHMYVTTENGFEVYDITDIANPVRVGSGFEDGLVHTAIQASNHIYLSNQLKTIDINNPANPIEVGSVTKNERDIVLIGTKLYAKETTANTFSLYSVSGVLVPSATIGSLHSTQVHVDNDIVVGNDINVGHSVFVSDTLFVNNRVVTGTNADIDLHGELKIFNDVDNVELDYDVNGNLTIDADVDMLTKSVINLRDPIAAQEAATKFYVDNLANGVNWKDSVRVRTTANITLSGTQTIDGVVLAEDDRVLVMDQTTQTENGIYLVKTGVWVRTADADEDAELPAAAVFVREGTADNADHAFVCTNDTVTLGSTNITFVKFSGLGQITGGTNISTSGDTINFDPTGGIDMQSNAIINLPNDTFLTWRNVADNGTFGIKVNASNDFEIDTKELVINTLQGSIIQQALRPELLTAGNTIFNLRATTFNADSTEKNFINMRFKMEDSTVSGEDASVAFNILRNGSAVDALSINLGANNRIISNMILGMQNNKIEGLGTPSADNDATPKIYVDSNFSQLGHTHVKADITDFAHTHDHNDITDFDAEVEAKRLDQFAVPTSTVDMNGQTLTMGTDGGLTSSGNELTSTIRDLIIENADGSLRFTQRRPQVLNDGNVIANFRSEAFNDNPSPETIRYAQWRSRMESDVDGSEMGSQQFSCRFNTSDLTMLYLNEDGDGEVSIKRVLDMTNQQIRNLGNPSTVDHATRKDYVDNGLAANSVTDQGYADTQDDAHSVVDQAYADSQDTLLDPLWASHTASENVKLGTNQITGDNNEVIVGSNVLVNRGTAATKNIVIERPEILASDTIIGHFSIDSHDSSGAVRPYGRIRARVEDNTFGSSEGSLDVVVRSGGGNKDYMSINNAGNDNIELFAPLEVNGNASLKSGSLFLDDDQAVEWSSSAKIGLNSNNRILVENSRDIVLSLTGNTPRLLIQRPEQVTTPDEIGVVRTETFDTNNVLQNFAQFELTAEDITAGARDGGMRFSVFENNSLIDYMLFNFASDNQIQIQRDVDMSDRNIRNSIIDEDNELFNASDNYIYVKTQSDFGITPSGSITSITDIGGGEVQVTHDGDEVYDGQVVNITGTTSYNGDHEVTRVSDTQFKFTDTFVADETGSFTSKKIQCAKTGGGRFFFYIVGEMTSLDPLLLTPRLSSDFVEYVFHTDVIGFNRLFFNYSNSLGAAFQGKDVFSLTRSGIHTQLATPMQTAGVRTVDVTFEGTSFSFHLDDALTDFGGGVLITDANFVTFKNNSFYNLAGGTGHKFVNCEAIDVNDITFTPPSSITDPVFEIDETVRITNATFAICKIPTLASGKNAFLIDSALNTASRIKILDCRVPNVANLFDGTGLDETDVKIQAQGNIGHKDSAILGDAFLGTPETVTINTINTPEVVDGVNWVGASINERFTVSTAGVLTYTGLEPILAVISVDVTMEKASGGGGGASDLIEASIRHNSTDDTDHFIGTKSSDPTSVHTQTVKQLVTNDTVQLIVRNVDSTGNIDVDKAIIIITET